MKIYRDCTEKLNIRTTVALGCFDGVHVAHAAVIAEAVAQARKSGTKALVFCFAEPPKNAFLKNPVPLITGLREKARLIEALGADVLVCPDFTPAIAAVGAREFVRKMLCSDAGAVHLVSGKNYSFGRGGEGNSDLLAKICRELGVGYTVVDDVTVDGVGVSSSEIRRAVSAGELGRAARLLGRDFSVCFEKKGGLLLSDPKHLSPPDGTYRVRLTVPSEKRETYAKIKTVDGGARALLLDFELSAPSVNVEFCPEGADSKR